jgi:hypothetical protein
MWDEPLSKITAPPARGPWLTPAPFDIDQARRQLAERFNKNKSR